MTEEPLLPDEEYRVAGVHIGTHQKSADMKRFIFRIRSDGLYVLDVKETDRRLKLCAKLLASYEPQKELVVAARQYAQKPASLFANTLGMRAVVGRYIPGTLTNPKLPEYLEPELIFITDPAVDTQALKEAVNIGIPIIAICDVNNETKYIDFVIPANNKGKRSLAVIYWLLTREVTKAKNLIKSNEEFKLKIEDFETEL
ncbi:MAG: 30S ribosomal protein S2 [Candidatus Thermoplasmatota archaeon]|nr:30S ribosomal protein S2 [Candidatus Thermoplasmatota archaeon]